MTPVSSPAVLVVSGTGTDVGKTVTTAAVGALAASSGLRVAVVKPVQTGEPPGPSGDLEAVRRLSGVTETYELARFPDPLSPATPRISPSPIENDTPSTALLMPRAVRKATVRLSTSKTGAPLISGSSGQSAGQACRAAHRR